MARVARPIDPGKIKRLQDRISDPSYLAGAVDLLAGRMTDRILDTDDKTGLNGPYRSANSSKKDIAVLLKPAE